MLQLTELMKYGLGADLKQAAELHVTGRLDEAEKIYRTLRELAPNDVNVLHLLGLVRLQQGHAEEALGLIDEALEISPQFSVAHGNRGIALTRLGCYDEALASYQRALELKPDFADALCNRGMTLQELGRFDEAQASFEEALTINPSGAPSNWNLALLRLLRGDLDWRGYEWRWAAEVRRTPLPQFSQPRWSGAGSLAGKTIFIHTEQGFGDTIMFSRYLWPLKAACPRQIIFGVKEQLYDLMQASFGDIVTVIHEGDYVDEFDYHCPLLSLPLAFKTATETIPAFMPYLKVPQPASETWRFPQHDEKLIGLAWSGAALHGHDMKRSMNLVDMLPLLRTGATYISLQKEVSGLDRNLIERHGIVDPAAALLSFADTAAIISQLDLVITVDTAVAHLAGALGKPVWLLLSYVPDWRWLLDRSDSPWYPTARLFRQDSSRSWDGVIETVAKELRHV